jgi:hypothetical protein
MIEERFKVFSKSGNSVTGILPYDETDFVVGGSYADNTYTVLNGGIYLLGYSYNGYNPSSNLAFLTVKRNGSTIRITSTRILGAVTKLDFSVNCFSIYRLEAGDEIYVQATATIKLNVSAYSTDDIYNSFWGIRIYE